MKIMIKASSIFVFLIMVVSCSTTSHVLPEKYNLNNELEEVKQISAFRDIDCELVDYQSIILEVNRDDYFLLVLRRPIETRYSQLSITIDNTASKDRAYSAQRVISQGRDSDRSGFHQAPSNIASIASGYDKVVVREHLDAEHYVIDKIYRLKGKEHAEEIKERLRNS
ncbi:MAG: hypothetical protein JW896_02270 [Deltaproteobacteria bacterium]|nr:hypothetical protein [Deltaproteobacteria bacterium]